MENVSLSSLSTYDQVFSTTAGTWPHLQDHSLRDIVVRTMDILQLRSRTPDLRSLTLDVIALLDAKWEWIMEHLHEHIQLNELIIMTIRDWEGLEYGLRYPDGTAYGEDLDGYIPKVEQYVTRQGPRPKV